jgi:hypothetical protein
MQIQHTEHGEWAYFTRGSDLTSITQNIICEFYMLLCEIMTVTLSFNQSKTKEHRPFQTDRTYQVWNRNVI